ncbi:MAG: alpha-L-fucosidase [Phycisphaerae bacterium]|nr:alpha-L-fucosidase [Phycisphaerae bacterium]
MTAKPTQRQLDFQDWEFGLFIHFLAGQYTHQTDFKAEKDSVQTEAFDPSELDCQQWAQLASQAGARYMVYTAKHHDGFCHWPSATTPNFSTAACSWRDGAGDVVGEFVDACRGQHLAVGLYYSPFDAHEPSYQADPPAYDEYFLSHMRELLGGAYGPIDILWFDGAFSEGHAYNWPMLIQEIRAMQPEIRIFNMGDPDFRWVGNEAGIASIPNWNTVEQVPFSIESDEVDTMPAPTWLPAECDCRLRYEGWTWRGTDDPLKSVEELMGLYDYSVGRGCNLLLNVGPDLRGRVHEEDAARLTEFGEALRRRFGSPLCTRADCRQAGNRLVYEPAEPFLMDHAVIQEDITRGEHVRRFAIRITPAPEGRDTTLYEGKSIGHKAICRFPLVKACKAWLEIVDADGEGEIRELQFHNTSGLT